MVQEDDTYCQYMFSLGIDPTTLVVLGPVEAGLQDKSMYNIQYGANGKKK